MSTLIMLLAACGGEEGDSEASGAMEEAEGAAETSEETEDADAAEPEDDSEDGASEETASGGLDEVCAAGAEEGGLEYWATFDGEQFQQIQDRFSEAYPGIEVELLPLTGEDQLQRILTADAAGEPVEPDVVSSGMVEIAAPLAERGLLDAEVDWTALGVDADENVVHEATNAVRVSRVGTGLAYNTDTTSPEDLPDTWEELIDEQYAGELVVDPRGTPFELLGLEWGVEQTTDYIERLFDVVDPIVLEGGTAGMVAVLNGEAMTTAGGRSDSLSELQADGAPMGLKYLDIVPTQEDYNALTVDAENPNAAKCFVAWLGSAEGAETLFDATFKRNDNTPDGAPEGATFVSIDSEETADQANEVIDAITPLYRQ